MQKKTIKERYQELVKENLATYIIEKRLEKDFGKNRVRIFFDDMADETQGGDDLQEYMRELYAGGKSQSRRK